MKWKCFVYRDGVNGGVDLDVVYLKRSKNT